MDDLASFISDLGKKAAIELGYNGYQGSFFDGWSSYRPVPLPTITKDQIHPGIAISPRTLQIRQKDYQVTFFFLEEPLFDNLVSTCSILGRVNDGTIDRLLAVWDNDAMTAAYRKFIAFIDEHPYFVKPARPKAQAKSKLSPSQLEI